MYTDRPAQKLRTKARKCVFLPIGSCEQHGPHLPIDTDLRIAQLITENVAATFLDDTTVLLPALPFSCSWEHKGIGTLALSTSTLSAILHDIAQSLTFWGMPVFFVIVNWHGGNTALGSIATEITAQKNIPTAAIQVLPLVQRLWRAEVGLLQDDIHAGLIETSIIQAYWPALVNIAYAGEIDYVPDIGPTSSQLVLQALGIYGVSQNGVWGTPRLSQPERGRTIIISTVEEIHRQVSKLLELLDTNQVGD
jgi:creatinine amidohydrolase